MLTNFRDFSTFPSPVQQQTFTSLLLHKWQWHFLKSRITFKASFLYIILFSSTGVNLGAQWEIFLARVKWLFNYINVFDKTNWSLRNCTTYYVIPFIHTVKLREHYVFKVSCETHTHTHIMCCQIHVKIKHWTH